MFRQIYGTAIRNLGARAVKRVRKQDSVISENIFFLHIPKCGGTSVIRALSQKYQSKEILTLDPISSAEVSNVLNIDLGAFREYILMYSLATRGCRHVTGHYFWSDKAYKLYEQKWKFVTILRHPVEKWFSQYYFNRYKDEDHFKIEVDVESFLNSQTGKDLGNSQICQLSDVAITDPDEMLEAALSNLEKFDVIGVTECLDRFQQDFKACFKVPLNIPHLNKSPAQNRKLQASDNPDIRKKVEELCKRDMILYQFALDKLGLHNPS